MGNLLKVLTRQSEPGNTDIFIDFENASPTESEREVYEVVREVLGLAPEILKELEEYKGASEEIREAIANPRNDGLQEYAWAAVLPLVAKLKRFYEFSIQLENVLPQLLYSLCGSRNEPLLQLDSHQALAKQFAEILHYTLKFDDLKMCNPSIQNDFSYYRRTLSRKRMDGSEENCLQVSTEMANRMSLFYAYPTPFLKTLSDATGKFVSDNKSLPIENTTDMLGTLAKLCREMIENPAIACRFQNEETKFFCLRVMVGVIILYDHVHPVGAFAKNAAIDMRASIKILKDQQPSPHGATHGTVDGLLNALRYTTKHLNDESTPKNVKIMLTQ
ncbi:CYFIP-related Rac1 interactor B-like [Rhopilema esculentum]|uniref:CYFIP-related Rac1 interactor B-like n=1 Tax=Rhopilema esculentum TaxID=499914 RepID=UPI0031D9EC39|eukprot:gene7447-13210_t